MIFVGLAVSRNESSPVLNVRFPVTLGSGRLNTPLTLPDGPVIKASPKIKLESAVENPSNGFVKEETSTLSKKGYNCVFGRNALPSKLIILGLQNGSIALAITLVPCDSRSIFSITSVLIPVLV